MKTHKHTLLGGLRSSAASVPTTRKYALQSLSALCCTAAAAAAVAVAVAAALLSALVLLTTAEVPLVLLLLLVLLLVVCAAVIAVQAGGCQGLHHRTIVPVSDCCLLLLLLLPLLLLLLLLFFGESLLSAVGSLSATPTCAHSRAVYQFVIHQHVVQPSNELQIPNLATLASSVLQWSAQHRLQYQS
jgi:hypothetical protein